MVDPITFKEDVSVRGDEDAVGQTNVKICVRIRKQPGLIQRDQCLVHGRLTGTNS